MKRARGAPFNTGAVRQLGFSLMELMIIIAIIGTLSMIAIPNILSYRDNARLKAAATEMLATFRKAQVTAVKRHFRTVLNINTVTGTTTVFLDNGAGPLPGGVAEDSVQNGSEPTIETYTVPAGCILTGETGGVKGFTPRGLPIGIAGAIEIHSNSTNARAQYRVTLTIAGHSSLKVSTDGGSTWQ